MKGQRAKCVNFKSLNVVLKVNFHLLLTLWPYCRAKYRLLDTVAKWRPTLNKTCHFQIIKSNKT